MRRRSGLKPAIWLLSVGVLTLHAQSTPPDQPAPSATPAVRELIAQSARAASAGDSAKALDCADQAIAAARSGGDAPGEALAHRARAQQLSRLGRPADAIVSWVDAESASTRAGDPIGAVEAAGWQAILEWPENPERGSGLLTRALEMAVVETTRPRALVSALNDIGRGLLDRSLLAEGKRTFESSITIAEKRLGDSTELASAINGVGAVAYMRGELPVARTHFLRVLEIRQKLAPDSLAVASILNNLGNLEAQGDRSIARTYFDRALRIREKLAPNSLDMASSLQALGTVALNGGDLPTARDYYTRALALHEKLAPGSIDHARTIVGLGDVALDGGDLDEAETVLSAGADDSTETGAHIRRCCGIVPESRQRGPRARASDRRARLLPAIAGALRSVCTEFAVCGDAVEQSRRGRTDAG